MSEPRIGSSDHLAHTLAVWLHGHPKTVMGILLATLLGSLSVLPHLKIQAGTAPFIDRSLPEKHTIDRINEQFGSDGYLLCAIGSPALFTAPVLQEIRTLGDQVLNLSVVNGDGQSASPFDDVTSLATVKDLQGSELSFRTAALLDDPIPLDPLDLIRVKERAAWSPVVRDNLLAEDLATTTVMLRLTTGLDDDANANAVAAVRGLLDGIRARHPGVTTVVTGDAVVRADTAHYMLVDLLRFVPVVYVLCLGVLIFLFRTWRAVVAVAINITLCLLAGMAALTLIGGSVNNLSTILPPVLVVVATATMIHFLSELARNARTHGEERAPVMTAAELLGPQLICAVTTAVGFASLSVSTLPAMQDFGVAAAIGNMVGLAISFMTASVMARYWPVHKLVTPRSAVLSQRFDRWVNRYTDLVIARPKRALAVALTLVGLSLAGMTMIVVDMRLVEGMGTNIPARRDTDIFEETMGGSTVILVSARTDREQGFLDPQAMQHLDRVAEFLKSRADVTHVMSVTDHVKLMNRAFMSDAPDEYRIPDTREQVAQLMLLNGDPTVSQYLDTSYRWARIMARTTERSSAATGAIFRDLDRFLATEFPASEGYTEAVGAGESRVWAVIVSQVVQSQINTFGLSFLLIFAPIFLFFRSFAAGLFSIPSNLFPVVLTMGLMGFGGIFLDIGTVMSASVVLGIAVDDTIHFLSHIRSGLRSGQRIEDALRQTLHMKGAGAIWTALLLCAGFGVVMISTFSPTRNFGILACSAMISGVVGEVLLLPPMLLLTRTRLGIKSRSTAPALVLSEGSPLRHNPT